MEETSAVDVLGHHLLSAQASNRADGYMLDLVNVAARKRRDARNV